MKYLTFKKGFIILGLGALLFSCKPDLGDFTDGFNKDKGLAPNVEADTSTALTNTSKYPQARSFPGLVCDNARTDTTINLELNYVLRSNDELRISVAPTPLFSTGLYAAPGDLVTIEVPQGEYSLSVQVGAWTDNLTGKEANGPLLRDPRITVSKALVPGINLVRNLYGGHIYILPSKPVANPVQLKFTRVCVSPDFVLGKTTNAEWQQKIRNSCVPWLELRSKHIIYVVSREFCLNKSINDPHALMTEWDLAIKSDFFEWTGLKENASDPIDESPALPYRVVFDVQPSVGYGHSGMPIVVTNDYHWFGFSTDLSWLKGSNVWGIYHELGHNMQMAAWSWSTLGETSNNLFNFKLARRNELSGYPNAWPARQDCSTCTHGQIFANAINNFALKAGTKNFDANDDTTINDPFRRMTPFLQIFDYIKPNMAGVNKTANDGWSFMSYLYSQGRHELRVPTSDILKHDFLYSNLCEYTQMDWLPFFQAWGIQLSSIATNKIAAKYTPILKEVWKYNPATRIGGTTNVPTPYDRSSWTVTGSTFNNDAPNDGRYIATTDGNITTYWHSQYNTAPPNGSFHWLSFGFTANIPVAGVVITQRQASASRQFKKVGLSYSTDNTNWTRISSAQSDGRWPVLFGTTPAALAPQTISFPSVNARYIRVEIYSADVNNTATNGDQHNVCLAEFDIIRP